MKVTYENLDKFKKENKMVTSVVTLYKTYHNIYTH